jgi:hypothetical protein
VLVYPSSRSLITAAVAFIDRDQTRKLQSGTTLSPYLETVRGALRKITPNGGKVRYKE